MIVAKTFYTLICDSCGEDLNEGQEVTAWSSSIEANYEVASASTWHTGLLFIEKHSIFVSTVPATPEAYQGGS